MKKHYVAMAGLRGYLPIYCEVFPNKEDARDSLEMIHELEGRELNELDKWNFVDLDLDTHGNEYAEIIECDCDNPQVHSEHEVDLEDFS